jgi:hypothetical protein
VRRGYRACREPLYTESVVEHACCSSRCTPGGAGAVPPGLSARWLAIARVSHSNAPQWCPATRGGLLGTQEKRHPRTRAEAVVLSIKPLGRSSQGCLCRRRIQPEGAHRSGRRFLATSVTFWPWIPSLALANPLALTTSRAVRALAVTLSPHAPLGTAMILSFVPAHTSSTCSRIR